MAGQLLKKTKIHSVYLAAQLPCKMDRFSAWLHHPNGVYGAGEQFPWQNLSLLYFWKDSQRSWTRKHQFICPLSSTHSILHVLHIFFSFLSMFSSSNLLHILSYLFFIKEARKKQIIVFITRNFSLISRKTISNTAKKKEATFEQDYFDSRLLIRSLVLLNTERSNNHSNKVK